VITSRLRALLLAPALAAALTPAGGAATGARPASPPGDAEPAGQGGDTVELVVHRGSQRAGLAATVAGHADISPRRAVPELGVEVVSVPAGEADRLATTLAQARGVARVERDATARVFDTVTPNDPGWPDQWGLSHVGAPTAWAATTGSQDVTVAILDTGVDPDHPDLEANLRSGRDFTAAGDGGSNTDDHHRTDHGLQGHGTMAAGVFGALTDNDEGVAGLCWSCTIMPVRVMEPDGRGQLSRIAAGMVWAVDQGADVLNLSLGSFDNREVMRKAVAYARDHGVVVVAAAGNTGGDTPVYPAADDDVIGVGASARSGAREPFSSHGPWVDVAAPGCNYSTQPDGDYTPTTFCGTSSAAPLVSGTLALALTAESDLTAGQAATALRRHTEPVEGDWVAHGRIDAPATLETVAQTATPAPARVAGANRFATATELSRATFEQGASVAYLVTGTAFADALTAGAAAGARKGPVLLAAPDTLPEPTRAELVRLRPETVVVAGGPAAISTDVAAAAGAAAQAPVERLAGADRFDTAAAVAIHAFRDGAPVAYVATGEAFADALSAVPAAVSEGGPVLLTAGDQLPASTRQALAWLEPRRIVVLGGDEAVSPAVGRALEPLAGSGGVVRLAGPTRFATAATVSQATFDAKVPAAHVATGTRFADALAGGPAAAAIGGPLLLVTQDTLPAPTADELARLRPEATVTLGDTAAVSARVQDLIGQAREGDGL
jgi:putative cell wall-binding protein